MVRKCAACCVTKSGSKYQSKILPVDPGLSLVREGEDWGIWRHAFCREKGGPPTLSKVACVVGVGLGGRGNWGISETCILQGSGWASSPFESGLCRSAQRRGKRENSPRCAAWRRPTGSGSGTSPSYSRVRRTGRSPKRRRSPPQSPCASYKQHKNVHEIFTVVWPTQVSFCLAIRTARGVVNFWLPSLSAWRQSHGVTLKPNPSSHLSNLLTAQRNPDLAAPRTRSIPGDDVVGFTQRRGFCGCMCFDTS